MEAGIPMLLPKGIVTNTADIYREVASFPTVPADKVWQYWHVYTTTNKRLKDPTARRLENFWWHVWGSDRRFLSGHALARLYKQISLGPTIAPLQGPPNRWEGPDAAPLTRQIILAHLRRIPRQTSATETSFASDNRLSSSISPSPVTPRALSYSSKSPPLPHPILKKPNGPPSIGPRPTARFLSPDRSADASDSKLQRLPSPAGSPYASVDLPVVASKKKPSPAAKKFIAAPAGSKRRPPLRRRISPQSPLPPGAASRGANASLDARQVSLPLNQRTVSPIPERDSHHNAPYSPQPAATSGRAPGLSVKASGKRPVMPRRTVSDKDALVRKAALLSTSIGENQAATGRRGDLSSQFPSSMTYGLSNQPKLEPDDPPSRSIDGAGSPGADAAPSMARTESHHGFGRRPDGFPGHGRRPSRGLLAGATASTTNIAAQGTIIDQSGGFSYLPDMPLPMATREPGSPTSRLALPALLDSRLTPTPPSPAAEIPMGRTRSQLTLLLEREKARTGHRPSPNS